MNKNLKLSLDDLQVDSFSTTDGSAGIRGTVRAHITTPGCGDTGPQDTEMLCSGAATCQALCSAYCDPVTNPCTLQIFNCPAPSAGGTCGATCVASCGCPPTGGVSCPAVNCNGTCDFQTQCW